MDRHSSTQTGGERSTPLEPASAKGNEGPRRTKRTTVKLVFFGGAALCTLACLFLIGFLTRSAKPRTRACLGLVADTFSITLANRNSQFTAYLTNVSDSAIFLVPAQVQYENTKGRVWIPYGSHWQSDTNGFADKLFPRNSAIVSLEAGAAGIRRVRVVAKFAYNADVLTRALSQVVRRLPANRLPRAARKWLGSRGLLDGRLEGEVESAWVDNPGFDPLASGEPKGSSYATFRIAPAAPPPKKNTNSTSK